MAEEEEFVDEQEQSRKKKVREPRKRLVRECDMPQTLQNEIIEFAEQALDDSPIQKNQAQFVKLKLDKEKGGTWHVIVGHHFGGNITNDALTLMNFQLANTWFLVFRSGPPEKKA